MVGLSLVLLGLLYAVDYRYDALLRDGPGTERLLGFSMPLSLAEAVYELLERALLCFYGFSSVVALATIFHADRKLLNPSFLLVAISFLLVVSTPGLPTWLTGYLYWFMPLPILAAANIEAIKLVHVRGTPRAEHRGPWPRPRIG
jgi:hypothetical protein